MKYRRFLMSAIYYGESKVISSNWFLSVKLTGGRLDARRRLMKNFLAGKYHVNGQQVFSKQVDSARTDKRGILFPK